MLSLPVAHNLGSKTKRADTYRYHTEWILCAEIGYTERLLITLGLIHTN